MPEQTDTLSDEPMAREDWRRSLERALDGVLRPIRQAPKRSNGDTLYSLPWFLFCGDSQAAALPLLSALGESAPVAIHADAGVGDGLWAWRFFGDSVGVALAASVVENRHPAAGEAWSAMLDLLRRKRPLLPLNGIVLTVGAATLMQPSRDLALRLRALADGAMLALETTLPVYLVVTGLESIPGFCSYAEALPIGCRNQVMGHRFPEGVYAGADAAAAFTAAFEAVNERTRDVTLTLLREAPAAPARGIFQFAHGFSRLGPGLHNMVTNLTADSAVQRRPMWRGLYFTGMAGQPVFLSDLANRFLPTDQPLARRT